MFNVKYLFEGDWLDLKTEEMNGGGGSSAYVRGKITLSLNDAHEVRGKVTDEGWDGENLYGIIEGSYFVPPFLYNATPDLRKGSLVRATVFKSEQKKFWFRASTITEDTTA